MVKMAWRLTLAVAVMCVGSICSSVQADLMSRLLMQRDYGVKLCGREFIRAVIFTCGGSRWRRSTNGELESLQWASQNDFTEDTLPHVPMFTDNLSPSQSPHSRSLADLLATFFGGRQSQHQLLDEPNSIEQPQQSAFLEDQVERSLADKWPISRRSKRNFSLGVAGMCCNQGCTKNDIGRLC